jgi:hypothetical protein
MKFCSENSKDIQKYFQGAFIKFPGMQGVFGDGVAAADAGDIIHTVEQVTSGYIKGKRLEGTDAVPYEFCLYSEDEVAPPEIEFILPRKSFFNGMNGALMLFRIPARQYKRGVCTDNTAIVQLQTDGSFEPYPLTINTLTEYVGKQAYLRFEAHKLPSYAVTRRIAVAANGHVFMDRVKIGTVDYTAKTIKLGRDLFVPEIQKALRQHAQIHTFAVVVADQPAKKVKKTLSEKWGVGDDGELVNLMDVE